MRKLVSALCGLGMLGLVCPALAEDAPKDAPKEKPAKAKLEKKKVVKKKVTKKVKKTTKKGKKDEAPKDEGGAGEE